MLLKKLIYGNLFCAIAHTFINGTAYYHVLQLTYKKKTFEVISSHTYNTLLEATNTLKKGQHVFVIINHDKVLSKKIDGVHELNKAVSIAFPNIKSTDFAIEVLPQESHSFVTICRNSAIEKLLSNYADRQLNVIGYSLGNTIAATLLPYLTQDTIHSSNAKITIKNNLISSITKTTINTKQSYSINGLNISSKAVLSLSGILAYYTNINVTERNFTTTIEALKDGFKQKRIFTTSIKFGLGFILLLLLINFLFYSSYRDNINTLSSKQQVNESYKEALTELNDEVTRKRNIVTDITATATSRVSFYMDEIGGSIPTSILLSQLNFQPLQKSIKATKEITIESDAILVSGKSRIPEVFSDWINLLENKKWIAKVSVLEYGTGSKSKTAFEIYIQLKE